ncbi:alanine racemase [Aliidiomarina iranensis]|uniref:Alanine racemase n=1 Tax=Aliidiomarina iranensis TaxID=1434071 RepID=A0A432VU69_9GAMM|nr:alanine racemase [Aliidiomarina iranensis]RUO20032.1 alanine racemase [Aliidiomarina iranensis]
MADTMRPAWATINLQALRHNISVIRERAGGRRILGILKANAYGHGLIRIAQVLAGIDAIGVARVDEALQLRNAGISGPIVLLEGFFSPEQIPVLAASGIQPVIHNVHQLTQLEQAKNLSDPLQVWLKIDTGMHRLGVEPEEVESCYKRLVAMPHVTGLPILMSHLACADEPKHEQNRKQLATFAEVTAEHPKENTSIANSAALLAAVGPEYDWVRPGLSLYGVSPFSGKTGRDHHLQAVMNLQASVISIRRIKAGEPVGYGASWAPGKDTYIGIVAIGYGDGYPRHAPEGTPVWVRGKCYPMVGRVAMDMITIDLGAELTINLGDTAQLWGTELPVEEVAAAVGTIPYELLCNVARRVQLDYLD